MNEITLDVKLAKTTIDRNIYGHFSEHLGRCIYEGYWVGEDSPIPNVRGIRKDVVAALRKIKVPVMRWPGGCFADEYHWMDGIGPHEKRPRMVNTHWGGVVENNHFGTHEFMDLCEQLDCEPYICGNVGSGTVQEMSQWVEYVTFDGKSPMADLRQSEWTQRTLAAQVFWRRQRELGLRRPHDGRSTTPICTAATKPTCATTATTSSTASPAARATTTTTGRTCLMEQAGSDQLSAGPTWTAWRCITIRRSNGCPTARARVRRPTLARMNGSRSSPRRCLWRSWYASTARSWTSTILPRKWR